MVFLDPVGRFFALIGRFLVRVGRVLISLVRDDAYTEVRGTYPEMTRPGGEQSASQGSVTTSLTGLGSG
jgi:hypothetical protein